MKSDAVTMLGYVAGALTTIAFLPQLIKTWRRKSAADVSFAMLATFCTGVLLWLIYGLLIQSPPIFLANLITLILASTILFLKLRYG